MIYKSVTLKQIIVTSKSMVLMLPSLLLSALISFILSFIMRTEVGASNLYLLVSWHEMWLTSWAILFPVTYMLLPLVQKITNRLR